MKIYFKNFCCYKKEIEKIFQLALEKTKNDVPNLSVGICFASLDQIRELNRQNRQIDRPTDVLSFPFLNIDFRGKKLSAFDDEREPDGELYLGDIYICKKIAKVQAKEYGHSLKREVSFLALHGLLHLLGFDHIEKEEEKVMMKTADEILSACNINRGGK